MAIFVERFLLAVLVAIFAANLLVNPLNMDGVQRTAIGLIAVGLALLAARGIEGLRTAQPQPSNVAIPPTTVPPSTPPPRTTSPSSERHETDAAHRLAAIREVTAACQEVHRAGTEFVHLLEAREKGEPSDPAEVLAARKRLDAATMANHTALTMAFTIFGLPLPSEEETAERIAYGYRMIEGANEGKGFEVLANLLASMKVMEQACESVTARLVRRHRELLKTEAAEQRARRKRRR